jgi:GPI mannosyltransferase 4
MSFLKILFESRLKSVDPITVFYALRVVFAVGTWTLSDMAIDRLSATKQDRIKGLLFVATSYVTWTYQSHTFSNSVETVVLLWCLVIIYELTVKRSNAMSRHWDTALLAGLIVFGIFNRVTFPAFLILPGFHLLKHFYRFPLTFITFVCTGLVTVTLAIQIDTMLYNQNGKVPEHFSDLVITPLNNLIYNSRMENLSVHGLHHNLHHVLVNLPELLGPGLILLFSRKYIKTLPFQSALSGIICLSLVPHQEARFLVPAVPLLCQCFDSELFNRKILKTLLSIWLIFNIALGFIMGTLHQGGVIPAQAQIAYITTVTPIDTVIWWKTYSPPIWLLGKPLGTVEIVQPDMSSDDHYKYIMDRISARDYSEGDSHQLLVVDLMGASETSVRRVLDHLAHVSVQPRALFVSSFASLEISDKIKELTEDNKTAYHLNRVWSTRYHLSLENFRVGKLESLIPGIGIWSME